MDFFLAKERISLKRSFQLYWLYVLPFTLLPFLSVAIRAIFSPSATSIMVGACFATPGVCAPRPRGQASQKAARLCAENVCIQCAFPARYVGRMMPGGDSSTT